MHGSREANSFSAIQEIPRIFLKLTHHRLHKSPLLLPIVSQINPVHVLPSHILKIHSNIFLRLRLGLPSCLSQFPQLYTTLFSPVRATCPAHLIHLDLNIRIILGEEYRSLWSSFCSFLHSLFTSALLGPNIPQHPILEYPQHS